MSSFLTYKLIDSLLRAIEPIDNAYRNKESLSHYLHQHGIDVAVSEADFQKIIAGLNLSDGFSNSETTFQQLDEDADPDINTITSVISILKGLVTEIKIFNQGSPDHTLSPPLNDDNVWRKLGRETIDQLTYEAIEEELPFLAIVLLFSGIAEINFINNSGPGQNPYYGYKIDWDKLGDFLSDPLTQIKSNFGWEDGVNGFNYERFYYYLLRSFTQVGVFPRSEIPEAALLDNYYSGTNPDRDRIRIIRIPFHMEFAQDFSSFAEVGIQSMPIPNTGDKGGKPMGFTLSPLFKGGFTNTVAEDSESSTELQVSGGLQTDSFFRINVLPSGIDFESDTAGTTINAEIALIGRPENPYILIGSPDSHRVELEGFLISFGFKGSPSNPEFIFKAGTGQGASAPKLRFVFQAGESDGFLKNILGEDPKSIDLSGLLIWSSKTGIGFEGTAGFTILLPLHLVLGPINIDAIVIEASAGTDSDPKIGLGINLSGTIGPLSFVCEQIGAQLKLKPAQGDSDSGIFGNLNFDWGFQPPKGLGLSINAGAVIGGGYLFFDFDKQEYAGALELTIAGFISAKAIGLVSTKMPDGSPGFSMLIIITCEFLPPFQLSYGFTLNGVGGLLGLNRTVMLDPLREGVKTGSINNILFPQNVIANAPRIISDLKTIFPVYEGKFLIGPMAKIGWGTPSLITLSLGLIIEIPGNIAILGVLKIALPTEATPLVQIQVAFLGTIDFDKQMLTFDASLYESYILTMTLEGDMAVRLKWGESPDFLITVGGFHPDFTPPPLALPTLRRLAINILSTDIATIRAECYQAITSNTVQFGAHAYLNFDLSACSIKGDIGFDALFQFSPFHFVITASANFDLSAAGIDVMSVHINMSLDGPTPWRAKGTGSVSLLFFDISADFDKTWGNEANTTLPDIQVFPKLVAEFNKKESWSTALANTNNVLVSLRKIAEEEAELLIMHPAGSLVVQQKLIPLTVDIDKVGNQKSSDVRQAKFASANSNGVSLTLKNVNDSFARAQYQNLSDAEKISLPSFEKMPGGVEISMGDELVKNGSVVRKNVEYELTVIDKAPVKDKSKLHRDTNLFFGQLLKGNHAAKSRLSKNTYDQLQPFREKIKMSAERYTVAYQSNNKAVDPGATFENEMNANTFMSELLQNDPGLHNEVHIIPNYELQTA